jgi:iron-sulfur cluster assembly protein
MITLTQAAAVKIQEQLVKRGRGLGVRIGVKTTGCSGLGYTMEFVDHAMNSSDEQVFETLGVRVWVADGDLVYLQGIEIDWVKQGLNEGFEFTNPNEAGRCGCGKSFTAK